MGACTCTVESLCWAPETITTLLIATPQYKINSFLKIQRKKRLIRTQTCTKKRPCEDSGEDGIDMPRREASEETLPTP